MLMAPLIFWSLHWLFRLTRSHYLQEQDGLDELTTR
jgi:hypothetical protein